MTTVRSKLLPLAAAMLVSLCGTASAANYNTTIQEGDINTNDTYQRGRYNDNATYQEGLDNANRTIQFGRKNVNATGQFGGRNLNITDQRAEFKRASHNGKGKGKRHSRR